MTRQHYKKISLKPNSEHWYSWRHAGIGSSDIPAILGLCPYNNRSKILAEKSFTEPQNITQKNEYIMNIGHQAERDVFLTIELNQGIDIEPLICESIKYPWARASIDGVHDDNIYEVKLAGAEKINMLKSGTIPDNFYVQVQWQLFVTGFKSAWIIGIPFTGKAVRIDEAVYSKEIVFDKEKWKKIIWPKAIEFMEDLKRIKTKNKVADIVDNTPIVDNEKLKACMGKPISSEELRESTVNLNPFWY